MRDTPPSAPRNHTKPRRKLLLGLLLAVLGAVAIHHQIKPLPEGLALAGPERPLLAPLLLIDRTWVDGQGVSQNDHVIFDEVLRLIGQARQLVVVDRSEEHTSELQSRENLVCRLLLEKKKKNK